MGRRSKKANLKDTLRIVVKEFGITLLSICYFNKEFVFPPWDILGMDSNRILAVLDGFSKVELEERTV